jgi:mannose-6-phosphate isomerase-like protein (cupin superfamily)
MKPEAVNYLLPTILDYFCEENFSKQAGICSLYKHITPELQNVYFCFMQKINLAEKFSLFKEHWNPKIVGELNGQQVKLVKFKGPFVWHHHENEDELFYVVRGSFDMEFRDRTETIHAGEFIIVPRGVEHQPNAAEEVEVLLFEPASTLNTGNTENEKTVKNLQHL